MEYSIEFVTSWLKDASSHTTDIRTIWGMGGIGKTSLARYVYGLHSHEFNTSSYIGNISRRCDEKYSGLLDLQRQLCEDISKTSSIQVHDVSIYTSKIENTVADEKVFLVLDDIDRLEQLDALLGSRGFPPGSKIIITTKDAWVTESCSLFKTSVKPKHAKHLLRGLHETPSQKLLCFHAFMSHDVKSGYEEVLKKFLEYCEGHPLALEVLGKSLHKRDVDYWEEYIEGLKKETGSHIDNVLRMSFESLPLNDDKELFKHIACFFVGMDRDVTETILKACDINTRSGIANLIDKCLLSIDWNNKLIMHQLIQRMGRFIVHQESPHKPWKRSRLWCHDESFRVLKQKKGTENLLGLALDIRMLKKKLRASFELNTDALTNMDNLMLLQLNYVHISGSYENFPEEVRWLCMHGFPLKSIPSDLPMENVVSLDLSYSNIESFGICYTNPQLESRKKLIGSCSNEKRFLGSLKILNLSFCEQLRSLGGFDELPLLESLIVRSCIGLLQVCESIAQCVELSLIDLSHCSNLEKLPRSLGMLNKLKTLLLEGCNLGKSQIEIRDLDSPEVLKANNGSINIVSASSAVPEAIPSDLKFFTISLPRSLVTLSFENNNLSTESFPKDFSWLFMLKELRLDGNPIVSMPICVRSLPRLEFLNMNKCKMLKFIEFPPPSLKGLAAYESGNMMEKVAFDPEMAPLRLEINWRRATPLLEIEGIVKIQRLACVEEKVLRSLGWNKLDFLNKRRMGTSYGMLYEFGIFSTIYEGKEMPKWITDRNKGPSISFTIPLSPNKLRGFNICLLQTSRFPKVRCKFLKDRLLSHPVIMVSNTTKNCTWTYIHHPQKIHVDEDGIIFLSHWMFGMNEMEGGDHITITGSPKPYDNANQVTMECGVSLVYDDGEEEDALDYYKSWNHIIGGDLTEFQSTTGEYILDAGRIVLPGRMNKFRAFSQRKPGIPEDGS